MDIIEAISNLPLETLAALAAGYLGYRLAYVGLDGTHRNVDTVFGIIVFATIGMATSALVSELDYDRPWPQVSGLPVALLAAMVWRGKLSAWVSTALRLARISTSDQHLTAWDTVRSNPRDGVTAVLAVLDDGSAVASDDIRRFAGLPNGPCVFGTDGSLALFVTRFRERGSLEWTDIEVHDPGYGNVMTVFSADQIRERRVYFGISDRV